jgi:hypothetical protein
VVALLFRFDGSISVLGKTFKSSRCLGPFDNGLYHRRLCNGCERVALESEFGRCKFIENKHFVELVDNKAREKLVDLIMGGRKMAKSLVALVGLRKFTERRETQIFNSPIHLQRFDVNQLEPPIKVMSYCFS